MDDEGRKDRILRIQDINRQDFLNEQKKHAPKLQDEGVNQLLLDMMLYFKDQVFTLAKNQIKAMLSPIEATGEDLDRIGRFFEVYRSEGESEEEYQKRIIEAQSFFPTSEKLRNLLLQVKGVDNVRTLRKTPLGIINNNVLKLFIPNRDGSGLINMLLKEGHYEDQVINENTVFGYSFKFSDKEFALPKIGELLYSLTSNLAFLSGNQVYEYEINSIPFQSVAINYFEDEILEIDLIFYSQEGNQINLSNNDVKQITKHFNNTIINFTSTIFEEDNAISCVPTFLPNLQNKNLDLKYKIIGQDDEFSFPIVLEPQSILSLKKVNGLEA